MILRGGRKQKEGGAFMERNIMQELAAWRKMERNRMPLLLYGVRQVGKTYILREFGDRYFKNTVYVNFERMKLVAGYFEGELDPERIIRFLEEYFDQKIIPDETLLIFDEIQECERALASLKYFCEETPEYHIAAAGSLLGVAVNRKSYSFPVGKVMMKTLYPLRFDEFLGALGQHHLVSLIQEHFEKMQEMPQEIHQEILYWYNRYLFIGGMPAAINQYMERRTLVDVPEIQNLILNAYVADMAKYTSESESTKVRNAFRSMPAQLAKENKKFQYKLIRKGATAGLFGDSIAWLVSAGVVLSCDRVTRAELPLVAFRDVSAFKLYLSDVGLLTAFTGILWENIVRNELSDLYRGALAENYVAQTLRASGYEIYYWTSEAPVAEVDFVIQAKGKIVPVEVKSGVKVSSKSLKHFCDRYKPKGVIRLSEKNFGTDGNVFAVPLYAAFCL